MDHFCVTSMVLCHHFGTSHLVYGKKKIIDLVERKPLLGYNAALSCQHLKSIMISD